MVYKKYKILNREKYKLRPSVRRSRDINWVHVSAAYKKKKQSQKSIGFVW